jgi:hypothetical protein
MIGMYVLCNTINNYVENASYQKTTTKELSIVVVVKCEINDQI